MIFNLFCDASIDNDRQLACAGCLVCLQDNNTIQYQKLIIQNNATNNSAEILAIWSAINEVINLNNKYKNSVFRIFSDSKISLFGIRDWIKSWIYNMDNNKNLISSSGFPVANQQTFIDIYNLIVENDIHVEFYHQRGHVLDGKVSYQKAREKFINANKRSPESLSIDIYYISKMNDIIDKNTKNAIENYLCKIIMPDTVVCGDNPIHFYIRDDLISKFIENTKIRK